QARRAGRQRRDPKFVSFLDHNGARPLSLGQKLLPARFRDGVAFAPVKAGRAPAAGLHPHAVIFADAPARRHWYCTTAVKPRRDLSGWPSDDGERPSTPCGLLAVAFVS